MEKNMTGMSSSLSQKIISQINAAAGEEDHPTYSVQSNLTHH